MTKDNNKVATSPNNNDQVLKAILNVPTPTKGGKASTYALNEGVANMSVSYTHLRAHET